MKTVTDAVRILILVGVEDRNEGWKETMKLSDEERRALVLSLKGADPAKTRQGCSSRWVSVANLITCPCSLLTYRASLSFLSTRLESFSKLKTLDFCSWSPGLHPNHDIKSGDSHDQ